LNNTLELIFYFVKLLKIIFLVYSIKKMAEVGCLKDGNFQNLQVEGRSEMSGGFTTGVKSQVGVGKFVDDMHLSGLNPQWNLNFGGPLESQLAPASTINLLTPASRMHQLTEALKPIAGQTAVVSATQATAIFGGVGVAGADVAVTAQSFGILNQKVIRLTGNFGSIDMTDPGDLTTAGHQSLILFTNNVVTGSAVLKLQFHINNEFLAGSGEIYVSGDGTNSYTKSALSTGHNQLILTDTGASTILAGSFIYVHCGHNTDQLAVKACIRTTGGTIAVTEANND
jgi:hypothetical protein